MIPQLFALPLRALVVAAALPTPPALGAALIHRSALPGPGILAPLVDASAGKPQVRTESILRSATDPAGR
jgi:hypothetical protein